MSRLRGPRTLRRQVLGGPELDGGLCELARPLELAPGDRRGDLTCQLLERKGDGVTDGQLSAPHMRPIPHATRCGRCAQCARRGILGLRDSEPL
jgi:hypothetical protein